MCILNTLFTYALYLYQCYHILGIDVSLCFHQKLHSMSVAPARSLHERCEAMNLCIHRKRQRAERQAKREQEGPAQQKKRKKKEIWKVQRRRELTNESVREKFIVHGDVCRLK